MKTDSQLKKDVVNELEWDLSINEPIGRGRQGRHRDAQGHLDTWLSAAAGGERPAGVEMHPRAARARLDAPAVTPSPPGDPLRTFGDRDEVESLAPMCQALIISATGSTDGAQHGY